MEPIITINEYPIGWESNHKETEILHQLIKPTRTIKK